MGCTSSNAGGLLKAGYGFSADSDPETAVKQAIAAAGVEKPTFAFVSTTVAYDVDKVTDCFKAGLPGCELHGVTSCGKILQAGAAEPGVACLLLDAKGALTSVHDSDAAAAASALKKKVPSPKALIIGTTPGSEEAGIEALGKAFPGVPVAGGTAADDEVKGKWKLLTTAGAKDSGYSFVAVSDRITIGSSMLGPYTPTDLKATVTKAEGRKVFELNGKPALDWVVAWLGDAVKEQAEKGGLILPATADKPICTKKGDEFIPSHCAALDPSNGSVDFFSPMANGDELVVMDAGDGPSTGYAKTLVDAYNQAVEAMQPPKAGEATPSPKAGILLYCGGMSIAVGDNLKAGLSDPKFKETVGNMPMLGMTVFGEQCCMKSSGNVQRNLSMGFLTFA